MVAAAHIDAPVSSGDLPDRTAFYADLLVQARKQLKTSNDGVASAANISALIYHAFRKHYGEKSVNWVGFYISRPKAQPEKNSQYDRVLIVGPFHGINTLLACLTITLLLLLVPVDAMQPPASASTSPRLFCSHWVTHISVGSWHCLCHGASARD